MTPAIRKAQAKGLADLEARRFPEARMRLRKALRGAPRDPELLQQVGMAEVGCGRLREGLRRLAEGAALNAGDPAGWQRLAVYHHRAGRAEDAWKAIRKALAARPDDALALRDHAIYASAAALAVDPAPTVAATAIVADPRRTAEEKALAAHALAVTADKAGDGPAAMGWALEAGRRRGTSPHITPDDARRLIAARPPWPETPPGPDGPIFIVGAPRSGSTLVEQILARHSRVHAGGELRAGREAETVAIAWARAEEGEPDPARAAAVLPPEGVEVLAAKYRQALEAETGATIAGLWTDKMPDNLFRAPLLARLFPAARFVVTHRHPLDVAASCLMQMFTDPAYAYANDPAALVEHMAAQALVMDDLVAAPTGRVVEVVYEDLVSAPGTEIPALLAALGLDLEAACLAPESGDRLIATSSAAAVRRRINGDAIGKWRRYGAPMEEVAALMGGEAEVNAAYDARCAAARRRPPEAA